MRIERTRAAELVAANLFPAEADIETAFISLSSLATAFLQARASAKLSHVVGQDAFDQIGEATNYLFKARSKLIDAHRSLHQAQADIGLREVSFGPSQDIMVPTGLGTETVKVVASAT
jgi:hypothetical protein